MFKRTSIVKNMKVTDVSLSSIFEIGDSHTIEPRTRALAVQRQYEFFYGNEGNFNDPLFTKPLPKPVIYEPIHFVRHNESPFINVNNITITSASSAGVLHIGSTNVIDAESRVKHIRQLISSREENEDNNE